jgi:hypothetical protein
VAYFKIPPQHTPGWAEENNEKPQSGHPVSWPRFELSTPELKSGALPPELTCLEFGSRLIHRAITTQRNGSDLLVRFILFKIVSSCQSL